MTPDSVVGLLHMLDHWKLMLAQMQGEALPELPAVPGRRVVAPLPLTPAQDAEQRDADMRAARIWRALAADAEGGGHD